MLRVWSYFSALPHLGPKNSVSVFPVWAVQPRWPCVGDCHGGRLSEERLQRGREGPDSSLCVTLTPETRIPGIKLLASLHDVRALDFPPQQLGQLRDIRQNPHRTDDPGPMRTGERLRQVSPLSSSASFEESLSSVTLITAGSISLAYTPPRCPRPVGGEF